jgi:hypothetical protein
MAPETKAAVKEDAGRDLAGTPVSLPKGGGAIRGIGEKFAANPASGTGSMTVPLAMSPGRSGFGPDLSLAYDSGAGNGTFGFGWSLSFPQVSRKTDKGLPRYYDTIPSDTYLLSGTEDAICSPLALPQGLACARAPASSCPDQQHRDGQSH